METQLVTQKEFPYAFFPKEGFEEEIIFHYAWEVYELGNERYGEDGIGLCSMRNPWFYSLGLLGRIIHLKEDYNGIFFGGSDNNEYIRQMHEEMNGDIIELNNRFMIGEMKPEYDKLYNRDIAASLNRMAIFFLNSTTPLSSILLFSNDLDIHPFSKKGIQGLFRHIPLQRVW